MSGIGRPEEHLKRLLLDSRQGPGPDCPGDLVIFHAAAGLLSAEEHQAFEHHLEKCLYCRDRELEARKLLHLEVVGTSYLVDPQSGRLVRLSRAAFLTVSARSLPRRLAEAVTPRRLAVVLASLLVVLLTWSSVPPALARAPAVLAAAKQVSLVRWLLPASVREYLQASLLRDRLAAVPAQDQSGWNTLAAQAEQHLLRALELDPTYADAHFLLAQLYAERYYRFTDRDALERARVHYLRTIALRPDHLDARYRLADDVYSAQGRWDQELEQYDAILRMDPTHLDARWARGWVHLERGEMGRAIADFREVLRQDPRDFDSLWAIGIAQLLSGDTAGLKATVNELRRVNPGRARLLETLAARGGASVRR